MYYNISIHIRSEWSQLVSAHIRHFSLCYSFGTSDSSVFFFLLLFLSYFFFFASYFPLSSSFALALHALRSAEPQRKKSTQFCTDTIHHSRSVSRRSRIQKLSITLLSVCCVFCFLNFIFEPVCCFSVPKKNSFFRFFLNFNVSKILD